MMARVVRLPVCRLVLLGLLLVGGGQPAAPTVSALALQPASMRTGSAAIDSALTQPGTATKAADVQEPIAIDPSSFNQFQPAGTADSAGNLYAVWLDGREGNNFYLRFAYRPADGDWGPSEWLDRTGAGGQGAPRIAVDGAGNAYAVWVDERSGQEQIYSAYRPAGGLWGISQPISTPTPQSQGDLALAVNRRGEAAVVWAQWVPGSGDIVFAAMRPVGGPWGAAEQVNISSGTLWAADVALDNWGRAYAIWVDRIGWPGVSHVYAASRPAGGAWGAPEAVRDSTVGNAFSSRVAVDSAGNVHAVWQDDRGGSGSDIYAAYRPAGGPWSANVRINDVAGKASQPALGLDGAGNIVAAWEDYRPGAQGVYTAVRPRGSGWGTNELLIPAPAAAAGKVRPAPGGILDPTQTTWSAGFNLGGNGNFFDYSYYYQAPNDPNDPNSPYNVYQGGLPGAGASGDCHRTATTAQAAAQSPAQGGGGDPCHGGNAGEEPPLNADPASVFSIQTMAEILQEVAAIEAWVDEHVPSFFPSLPSAPEFWLPDSDIPQPTQPSANLPPGSDQTPFYPVGEYYDVDYDLSFIRPPEETANAPSSSNDSSSSALDSEPTSPAFNRVTQTDVPTDVRSADDPNLHTQPQISAPEGPTTAELAEFFIRWTFSSPEPRWEPPDAVTVDLPDIADPVLPHSGEFVHTETPLRIPGRGLDYSLDLTYRSQLVYDGPVGWGWTHNYDQHIRPIGGGSLARQVSGGLTDIFSFDGANFAPATGRFTTIVSNTTGITLTERGGMVETYFPLDDAPAPGALRSIADRNGNTLTFVYDGQGRLQTVIDTLGRVVAYSYASATLSTGDANGRLTAVTDFSGRQVKLAYNAYGNLVGITTPAVTGTPSGNDFPSGKITRFAYTSGFATNALTTT